MSWCEDDDEDYGPGMSHHSSGMGLTSKPRFSNHELTTLLNEVMRHKDIVLKKYNNGVAANVKKKTWCDITRIINGLGENKRGVRQIMKKWADLKCDGKRRMISKRSGTRLPKKCLSRVDHIVEKILLMSPSKKEEDEDGAGGSSKRPPPPRPFSYLAAEDNAPLPLPGGVSFHLSPRSSPDFDYSRDPMRSSPDFEFDTPLDEDRRMDHGTIEDSYDGLSPSSFLTPDLLFRSKPGHTYSRTNGPPSSQLPSTSNPLPPADSSSSSLLLKSYSCSALPTPSSSVAPPSSSPSSSSFAVPIFPPPSFLTAPHPIPTFAPPAPSSSSHSMSVLGPSTSQPPPPYPPSFLLPGQAPRPGSDASPAGLPQNLHSSRPQNQNPNRNYQSQSPREALTQSAILSLQQQQAGRVLLGAVSRSLEVLAQSVQQLVESQQQFVQDSLQLQRETVSVLRDFSSAALSMLSAKGVSAAPPH